MLTSQLQSVREFADRFGGVAGVSLTLSCCDRSLNGING
jgi:hypothetical protein